MFVLQIEHPVLDYDGWKRAFDDDPAGRQRSGVRRYRIIRPVDDPKFVIIELEFDSRAEAEGLLAALQDVWRRVQGKLIETARARITEVAEMKTY